MRASADILDNYDYTCYETLLALYNSVQSSVRLPLNTFIMVEW